MKTGTIMAASLTLLLAAPVVAQTDEASPPAEATGAPGPVIEVIALEYAFEGLPTSVPLGTTLTLTNEGVEIHELALARIGDDVTETIEELLGMEEQGRDPVGEGLVEIIGSEPIIALPGETAEGSVTLDREGRYVAICFVPVGLLPEQLEELGVDITTMGPETSFPPETEARLEELFSSAPPHAAVGMVQEFMVTSAESSPGPLPAMVDVEHSPEVGAAEQSPEVSPDPQG
jgi:hypothetical protein